MSPLSTSEDDAASRGSERFWTVPNAICVGRLAGLVPLVWLAWTGRRTGFLVLLVILLASDWLDGKLARLLEQRTEIGARLDSFADGVMYAVVAVCFWRLEAEVIRRELPFFVAVFATWGLSAAVGLWRFRRLPSYHTLLAKISWLAAGLAAVAWILGDPRGVPWALSLVVLTNLEAVAVGFVLPRWTADVPSLFHAWHLRRRESGGQPPAEKGDSNPPRMPG